MAKKRKPGSKMYPLRLPDNLRSRVEKAAKDRNISLNAAILERLERSYYIENRFGGPRATAMVEAVGSIMTSVGESAGYYKFAKLGHLREWLDYVTPYDRAASAVITFLKNNRPTVDGAVPRRAAVAAIERSGVEAVEQSAAEVERQAQRAASDGLAPSTEAAAMWDHAQRRVAVEHGLTPAGGASTPQELHEKIQRAYADLGALLAALETLNREEEK